jgi:hypothetical protein
VPGADVARDLLETAGALLLELTALVLLAMRLGRSWRDTPRRDVPDRPDRDAEAPTERASPLEPGPRRP